MEFACRIARDFGRPDVTAFLGEMSARDMEIWRAWYEIEPRGDDRADYHAAFLAYYIRAAAGGKNLPTIGECLESLRLLWADGGEFAKAKERRQRKADKRLARQAKLNAEVAQIMENVKRGHEHRQMEHSNDA